ncbi:MAG: ABC transporter permease [Bdellovibrionia bacterium]
MRWRRTLLKWLQPLGSVLLGLGIGLLITAWAGENPWNVFRILMNCAFGSRYDLGMTLFYATPLIFTGLSVAVAFHAGLFNIGAEGQLEVGALLMAAVGIYFPNLPFPLAPLVGLLAGMIGGALWGAIPGWLKVKRGSHEVINTIMLNFISAGLCSWVTLYVLKNPHSQNPETARIGASYLIPQFSAFQEAPVSVAIFMALGVAFLVWFFLWKTTWGFELRAVGQNELAARSAGIDVGRMKILALSIAGGLAGLVGVSEVLGNLGRFKMGLSPGYGYLGVAVALLGRNSPLGVVFAALLFGALHKGSSDLDLETEAITRDFSLILQALVILSVSAEGVWGRLGKKWKKRLKRVSDRKSRSHSKVAI